MKIAILGYTGAGKSTLARKIGEKYDIPVLHLDKVNYTKNWKIRDIHESKEIVEDFLENESWVIDGNYSKLEQDRRVEEADKIIFLDFPRFECLKRAHKRYTHRNRCNRNAPPCRPGFAPKKIRIQRKKNLYRCIFAKRKNRF